MHYFLKQKGIQNNKFFLVIYDPDLIGVNPRDPNLNVIMKKKILRECLHNFWYFIREVVRIPDQGGTVGGGKRYKLDRANLALNFGFLMNWNIFLEIPRQHGKTISSICWYLWVFNFGTTNSEIMFMNKKHEDSKMNLRRLKEIRDVLPDYLQEKEKVMPDGRVIKASNNVESTSNPYNMNKITTKAGARNRAAANSVGRGCTMPMHWYDEYAFILYNDIIYSAATPAFKTASDNAKKNGKPYGILITTTPGDLTTDEGLEAYNTKEAATPFDECFYDYDLDKLNTIKRSNTNSSFFYMRFTYQQLGSGSEYFAEMVRDLKRDWVAIRREVLLEWSKTSDNSPFRKQDLDMVEKMIMKEPIYKVPLLNGLYYLNMYKPMDITMSRKYPPIIGVDVSGGYQRDSSAITIIDSRTTDVVADFNCNYISTNDLTKVIYELVVKYMPNAIVNIEQNGVGIGVISTLKSSKIKRNLYFEIKDRVIEERFNGMKLVKKTTKAKVFGFYESKSSRETLMEILRDRMENHKRRFISPIIFSELSTLEVKKNGRIEHADNYHDDQVFSYLMALYVWYEGKDLMENFHLDKGTLTTDSAEEEILGIEESYEDIVADLDNTDVESDVGKQLAYLNSAKSISYKQWKELQFMQDQEALKELLHDKRSREAYARKFNTDPDALIDDYNTTNIPMSVFTFMHDNDKTASDLQREFDSITDLR